LLESKGHTLTTVAEEAEVLVVNTCAFIDSAKKESIDAILEMAEHKRNGTCTRLVVTGCLAERYRSELKNEIPEIDELIGTGEIPEIIAAVEPISDKTITSQVNFFRSGPLPITSGVAGGKIKVLKSTDSTKTPDYIYDATTPRKLTTPQHFAHVKIAEGCNYRCAFCIIPTLRGHYRSRSIESIVEEANRLVNNGVRELILISQDTSHYGIDRNERNALPRLLRELNKIDGLVWIRLLYLYPTTITNALLDTMAECEKVCRYIDLPLQHAADDVLRRMGRPGTRRRYETLLSNIRTRLPNVTLRTTFIVGFPGETPKEFDELCDFIKDIRFDHVGVFTYSHEEDTIAHKLPDTVTANLKRRRRQRLLEIQQHLLVQTNKAKLGQISKILIDGPSPEHDLVVQGRLEGQAPEIDGVVYLTECDPSHYKPGQLVTAKLVSASDYDLTAVPLP
jgi:ribosomal protein S12 methylthiotransferase